MKRLTKAEYEQVREVGQRMSNVLYNLSQHKKTCDGDRSLMAELVRKWDAVTRFVEAQK